MLEFRPASNTRCQQRGSGFKGSSGLEFVRGARGLHHSRKSFVHIDKSSSFAAPKLIVSTWGDETYLNFPHNAANGIQLCRGQLQKTSAEHGLRHPFPCFCVSRENKTNKLCYRNLARKYLEEITEHNRMRQIVSSNEIPSGLFPTDHEFNSALDSCRIGQAPDDYRTRQTHADGLLFCFPIK